MRESTIERNVCTYAKSLGFLVYKFTSPAQRGVPDRIFINPNGVTGYIEFKAPGKRPTPLQMHELNTLRVQGCFAEWCDSVEEGRRLVDELNERTR